MSRRDALLRKIEAMNVAGRERHWALIPAALARRARPCVVRACDAIATRMANSDALRVNRVIGFGHRGEARAGALDDLIAFYREGRVKRFALELGPGPQSATIARWLAERGFRRQDGYSMMVRDLRRPIVRGAATRVRVVRARRHELEMVLDIFARTFATPASRRAWSQASAASGEREYFLAYVGDAPAGGGALAVEGTLAWLVGGATLTRWRHHGAHAALIDARLRRALRAGCRWAWSETTEPSPGRPQGSRRNMLRLGFEEAFVKQVFVWRQR